MTVFEKEQRSYYDQNTVKEHSERAKEKGGKKRRGVKDQVKTSLSVARHSKDFEYNHKCDWRSLRVEQHYLFYI